jgi:hypothetical protein
MSKEKSMRIEEPVETTEAPAVMTHTALTMMKQEGEWFIVEVQVNPKEGKSGLVTMKGTGSPSRDYAIERFKIRTIELGFFG